MVKLQRPTRLRHAVFSIRPLVTLAFLLLLSANPGLSSEIFADDVLTHGSDVQKELAGGHVHTYEISLAAAQYLQFVVEQRGIVIAVTLFGPDGKELIKTDNPCGAFGPIYVSTISELPGVYRLQIRSTETWANAGRYRVSIEELREAKAADQKRVLAEKNYAEGRQLIERPAVSKEDSIRKFEEARKKFDDALAYWQLSGNRHWIALTEYCLAVAHRSLGDRPAAAEHFDKSLAVKVDEYDWRLRATVFNDRGINYARWKQPEKALESLKEALRIYENHQDRRGQASALNGIGNRYLEQGKYRDALRNFQKAVPLRRAENDRGGENILLNNIASVSERLGEPHVALEGYSKALQIWQELHSTGQLENADKTLATGFNNVALAYDRLGEWQQALENYEQALRLYEVGAPSETAKTLDNIGEVYVVLGDFERARDYYERARLSAGKSKDARAEANVLNHIGQLYVLEGKLFEAVSHFKQALALREDDPAKANTLTNLGMVHFLQGNPGKALEAYQSALKLIESSEDRRALGLVLQRMGEAHGLLGEPAKALEALNRALPLWKSLVDRRSEAATLHAIAVTEREQGNLSEALKRSQESLNIIESLRTKVASQRLRSSFFASQQDHYELYIDIRMRLYRRDNSAEHLAATLQASEQSRARSLVDILTEARANISRGIGEELAKREREAQQRVNDKARVQMELLSRKHSKDEAEIIQREVSEAIAEYDAVKARIRASSPAYAQLTQPQSLTLAEMQQLLDDETLLLEYFLGEERSYLWLVSRTSITGVDSLPNRAEIERTAEAFYKPLTQPPSSRPNNRSGTRTKKGVSASQRTHAAALSQMLLGPIADRIGKKRLLIVGDGVLQYLPFGALPVPVRPDKVGQKRLQSWLPVTSPYLIEEHEITYVPSASTLAVLRSEADAREPGPLSVTVIADPVFTTDDDRWKSISQTATATGSSLAKLPAPNPSESRTRSGLKLVRLWATQHEADAIEAMLPKGRTEISLGFKASRATVIGLQDQRHRIVHFATHGDLNTEHPELSSIVLSLVDSAGRPQDGFLRLHDIYNLRLPADLIVLSACSTGLGRIIKGEGLIGLTRGFMHAGSPRVVASLWRVDDLGTKELMKRFYQHMTKEGMAPPLALRQSQVEMLRHKHWQSPYHWAGFVLQGEWKPFH